MGQISETYAEIAGVSGIVDIVISTSHSASTATAVITCVSTSLDIGDEITVLLGYKDDYGQVFKGYIKNLDYDAPQDVYRITAMDVLIRAVDYFIVGSSPENPYNFGKGISAENLVNEVLGLCGLSLTYIHPSQFNFGVHNDVEVNLVSAFDYSRMIADIITWSVWADEYGLLYFRNRKPYFMGDDNFGQIGWVKDDPDQTPAMTTNILSFSYKRAEKDLRNKVAVFGGSGISATASSATSYDPFDKTYKQFLPTGYYKTIVASYQFIDTTETAQKTADYNLGLYNRIKDSCAVTLVGNYRWAARKTTHLEESITGVTGDWYILSCDHTWSKDGFTTSVELTR